MWIFRRSVVKVDTIGYNEVYEIGYNENVARYNTLGNFTESSFVKIFTVDSMLKAMRLVNYLNGGDGTINSMIEDICNEERT